MDITWEPSRLLQAGWDLTTRHREEEVAWAAGLFEAEGSVYRRTNEKGLWYPRMTLAMKSMEAVEKFADIVGVGSVITWMEMHRWRTGVSNEVARLYNWFSPYLGERRLKQYRDALSCTNVSFLVMERELNWVAWAGGHASATRKKEMHGRRKSRPSSQRTRTASR